MPAYLVQGAYTGDAAIGLAKEGASARSEVVKKVVASLGGTLTSPIYYSFEDGVKIVVTAELPGSAEVAALSLMTAPGGVVLKITNLMSLDEIDKATTIIPSYRAPGK